ncbi:hypothetical protein AALK14_01035 [Butyricimonas hominis]|uniref:hypothetical protein n=1 Tax=Butyricimonas TaxID=574697 RepID=UPI0026DBF2B1|nr:hypothetical protein [uncultured Butyricimonas sp.]
MKRIILFVVFLVSFFYVQAQEFDLCKYVHYRNADSMMFVITDSKINKDTNLFNRFTRICGPMDRVPDFKKNREEWIIDIKGKILSEELERILQDSVIWAKIFLIGVHFDHEGNMLTVSFVIDKVIYELLPENWLKDIFNRLMKEKINVSDFYDFGSYRERSAMITIPVNDLVNGHIRGEFECHNSGGGGFGLMRENKPQE